MIDNINYQLNEHQQGRLEFNISIIFMQIIRLLHHYRFDDNEKTYPIIKTTKRGRERG